MMVQSGKEMDKYDVAISLFSVYKTGFYKPEISNSFCELAIGALKEKQEREKGCDNCKPMCCTCKYGDTSVYLGDEDICDVCDENHSKYSPIDNYCSECGRKLVE